MPSLSGLGWTVCCLFLVWERPSALQSVDVQCPAVGPVGAGHPVQGLLERFEAGPGCAAREHGKKETHVIALGRVTNSPENKVTVFLKPLSSWPLRPVHLVLSSKIPVTWWLEAERLPSMLPVLVQVSSNSTVLSHIPRLRVHTVSSLPFHPRALHRWALKHHGNLTSLTHTTRGNRVYIRLGEDETQPAVCQLQSMFLSHNYMTSDLQPQEVQGCAPTPAGSSRPEVHVIKLYSAGSGLCGSLQVEVVVSLVPPVANSKGHNVVLILSSSVPVNWAIAAPGVQGHISVHSSNSVSPPYPLEPDQTLSSTRNSDLTTTSDLLVWASESGYTKVTSYTEADLANRFVIQLAEGGTDEVAIDPLIVGPESFTVKCEDGRLSVAVDQHIMQSLSVPVAAVTLRDQTCQAQFNGSHFLLVFPVFSCGTEGQLLEEPPGVKYSNMVLLWRDEPRASLALSEKSKNALGIHFDCQAAIPSPVSSVGADDNVDPFKTELNPWVPNGPGSNQGLSQFPPPRPRSGPVLLLQLFVTESYKQAGDSPCVITADHRVYVEISAEAPLANVVEVKSCTVSPHSDPKRYPVWTVISDGCSSDSSLTLSAETKQEKEVEGDGDLEEEEGLDKVHLIGERRGREERMHKNTMDVREEEDMQPLRFSFILRPVFNNSMQFLHCSLRLCVSDSTRGEPMKEPAENDCEGGQRIPPLISKSPRHQCEIRHLYRPMVVTQPISSMVPKVQLPAGPRTKRLSVAPLAGPDPQHSSSVVQTGPVVGIIFAAFVMGVGLMGGLWCIYNYTGSRVQHPVFFSEDHLTVQTPGGHVVWNPPSLSDLSSSSV